MIVVCDTSSLYYAVQIQCHFLLPLVFGDVYIPPAVRAELIAGKEKESLELLFQQPWLRVQSVTDQPLLNSLLTVIDTGEAEAITLAIELGTVNLLIDEGKGTAVAEKLHLKPFGLLGFLLLAKKKSHIEKVKPFLTKLINETSFRYTDDLIQSVLMKADE